MINLCSSGLLITVIMLIGCKNAKIAFIFLFLIGIIFLVYFENKENTENDIIGISGNSTINENYYIYDNIVV